MDKSLIYLKNKRKYDFILYTTTNETRNAHKNQ